MRKPLCTPLLASLLLALAVSAPMPRPCTGLSARWKSNLLRPGTRHRRQACSKHHVGHGLRPVPVRLDCPMNCGKSPTRFPVTLYTGTDCTPATRAQSS
jgi:hypothetical protein